MLGTLVDWNLRENRRIAGGSDNDRATVNDVMRCAVGDADALFPLVESDDKMVEGS